MATTMGTPAFMAPEMCGLRSSPFAPFAAELWAIGVCLFMFVFGRGEDRGEKVLSMQHAASSSVDLNVFQTLKEL